MDLLYTIQIPVYNETNALKFSMFYFNRIGLKPNYVLDSQHSLESKSIIDASEHEAKIFHNDKPYIENGYEEFSLASPTDWILRLDCDEVPSLDLITACNKFIEENQDGVPGFERHQVLWQGGNLLSAKGDRFDSVNQRQWRLYNRKNVRYNTNIHTPGIHVDKYIPLEPQFCAYHLAWEFLTWEERLKKAARYDAHGQPEGNRKNQLLRIEDAQMTPFTAPLLNEIYLLWRSTSVK